VIANRLIVLRSPPGPGRMAGDAQIELAAKSKETLPITVSALQRIRRQPSQARSSCSNAPGPL